jgi:hypothetical protein
MKKLVIKTSILMVTILFLVIACEDGAIIFDSSLGLVGFTSTGITINENQDTSSPFYIYFGAAEGTPATTVTLSVDTVGLGAAAAKEGIDFTISSKSISAEIGEDNTANVTPIDNGVFTGNKRFYLVISASSSSQISAQKRFLVTIADDEHPLKNWLGSYTVTAVSYGNPGGWDEEWSILTTAVEGHLDQIAITGLGYGSTEPLIATVDKDALTISIVSGQTLGAAYGGGNGEVKLYYGTDALIGQVLAGEEITSEMLTAAGIIPITGTIETDGTIHLDKMGMVLTDYDWCWDVFDTTWDKN